jgi:hypothetical protein
MCISSYRVLFHQKSLQLKSSPDLTPIAALTCSTYTTRDVVGPQQRIDHQDFTRGTVTVM